MKKHRWLGLSLVIFLIVIFLVGTENASMLPDDNSSGKSPSSPSPRTQATPTPVEVAEAPASGDGQETQEQAPIAQLSNPPAPVRGGTCIQGSIIDHYHQTRGGPGWAVTVSSEGTSFVQDADADGHFMFAGLHGGTWTVALNPPARYPDCSQPITPLSFPVTLTGNDSDACAQVRFKVETLACLDVTKLDDDGHPRLADEGHPRERRPHGGDRRTRPSPL